MDQIKGLISIVIPAWNDGEYVEKCFDSIRAQTYKALELIVVDNNSSDGSLEKITALYPDLAPKMIKNRTNLGFAKAMNQGITASKGEFVMALNMDVVMDEHFIEKMIKAFREDNVGSASGKLYRFPDEAGGEKIIDTTGHVLLANRGLQNRGEDEEDIGQYDCYADIFGVSGAAAVYRREMLEDIKICGEYFDEYFFALYEDTDLDWRAILRCWKCIFVPDALAYHKRRARKWVQNIDMRSNVKRNKFLSAIKNDHLINYFLDLPVILAYELDSVLYGHFKDYRLLFLEYLKMALGLPSALAKRFAIGKRRKISAMSFRKYIKYEPRDYKKATDLFVLIAAVCLLCWFVGYWYTMAAFFTVFFLINPIVYFISSRFTRTSAQR